jgi:NADH-quinone oxidoreductase subunit N
MGADLVAFLPELALAALGMVVLVAGLIRRATHGALGALAVGSLVAVGVALSHAAAHTPAGSRFFFGMLLLDPFAVFFKSLFLVAAVLAVLLSLDYLKRYDYRPAEYHSLVIFSTLGMMVMASTVNLIAIWVGLELMALSTYVLAGYFRREVKSHEAAAKYFVLGALSSGVLLFGMSLLYGACGSLDLGRLAAALAAGKPGAPALVGMALLACGFLFKVAAVPFHVWTPDVYEGAPTPITAFLSVGPKAAAFAMFLRVFLDGLAPLAAQWRYIVAGAAALTMIWGNVAALTQDNVKRMLAYSSIAHAGYALLGLIAGGAAGVQSVLLYMLIYTITNLGAFGFVILLESRGFAGETVDDYAGLARKHPAAAFGMLLFLLSLGGIPPTAGFMGKLYLFAAAVNAGYVWLVVVGVLMSAVSLYYYLRIVLQMYLREGDGTEPAPLVASPWTARVICACGVLVLAIGVYPLPFANAARAAMAALGGR